MAPSAATPYIPTLEGGADLYGLTSLVTVPDVTLTPPPGSLAALIVVQASSEFPNFEGFDQVFLVNLTDSPLANPNLGVGLMGFSQALLVRGLANSTPVALSALEAQRIYTTLVPEHSLNFTFGAAGLTNSSVDILSGSPFGVLYLAGTNSCPTGAISFLEPPTGTVDARQPHPRDGITPSQGIQMLTVSAPAGADEVCWQLCETGVDGGPNSVISVVENPSGLYVITLARPITPEAVTRLFYDTDTAPLQFGEFTSHPANVNGDSTASAVDILRLIDCLNGIGLPSNCPWGAYSQDINHDGHFDASDITGLIDLLQGAGTFDSWAGTMIPTGDCP